tara:strand:- start:328 stop:1554 length:1227 start_codon:yes stop_codon:yes gene_type:complete
MSRSSQHRGKSNCLAENKVDSKKKSIKLQFSKEYEYVKKIYKKGTILHNWKIENRKKLNSVVVITWINERKPKKNNKKKLSIGDQFVEYIYKINWGFTDQNSNIIYVGNKAECFKLGTSHKYFNAKYRFQGMSEITSLLETLENPLIDNNKSFKENIIAYKDTSKGGIYADGWWCSNPYGSLIQATNIKNYTWFHLLKDEFSKDYFIELKKKLNQINTSNEIIYPPANELFTCLNLCDFDNLKVVIIGQDPYHNDGQAHGLAFSVRENHKIPPSLKNIFKERRNDLDLPIPESGCLNEWAEQGVLLLNTSLTVSKNKPNSHKNIGWHIFTNNILQLINNQKDNIVFILWGNNAISFSEMIDTDKHHIIASSHPSPLGATKTDRPFIGSKCFSRCNQYLLEHNKTIINW